jgi:hypothetical protein
MRLILAMALLFGTVFFGIAVVIAAPLVSVCAAGYAVILALAAVVGQWLR